MKNLIHFALTLVTYAMFDLAWLNLFAKNFVHRQVGQYLAAKPDLMAALVFYLIFTAGLIYFCIWPANSARQALLNGAFFGLVTYGTYELVNKALLHQWPYPLVVVDMAWGIFVGAIVSWIGFRMQVWLGVR
ncbi:MAG: DUF2177 family protein [Saprospiraceae bacterium]